MSHRPRSDRPPPFRPESNHATRRISRDRGTAVRRPPGRRRRRRPAGQDRPPVVSRRTGLLHLRAAVRHPGRGLQARHRASRSHRRGQGARRLALAEHPLLARRGGGRGPLGPGLRQGDRRARTASTGPACSPTASACAAPPTPSGSPRWRPCSATAGAGPSASTGTTRSRSSSPAAPTASGKWALLDHDLSTVVFDPDGSRLLGIGGGRGGLEAAHRPGVPARPGSTAGSSAACTPATPAATSGYSVGRVPGRLRRPAADGPPAARRNPPPLPAARPGGRQDVRLLGPELQRRPASPARSGRGPG